MWEGIVITRGFFGARRPQPPRPLPPGQYWEQGFPVLSAGVTPHIPLNEWRFSISRGSQELSTWSWEQMLALPQVDITTDIHCVTKWSKLDSKWRAVSVDTFFEAADIVPPERFVMAYSYGGYTTNLSMDDIRGGKAYLAHEFEGKPLDPQHGGPARLLVPHLYFWKSAKWVRGLRLIDRDAPGFWEQAGYHMRGDPWKEERYWGD
ncbi:MAG: sulfite oxidase-like oxidoreductase [Chloroflexi bacterium]|nr:sulfite oxidase-like oxidoreductase [Chloroflexota bacterium]